MGVNDDTTVNKGKIQDFLFVKNMQQATQAERNCVKNTQELVKNYQMVMNPMPRVPNQSKFVMQVDIGEAHFLEEQVRGIAEKNDRPITVLDLGTFTGLSAGAMARGLDPEYGGKVVTVDVEGRDAELCKPVAEQFWNEEVNSKGESIRKYIDHQVREKGSTDVLREALEKQRKEGRTGTYDFVFIDHEKLMYSEDLELLKELLNPGGKIVTDNQLWSGRAIPMERTPENADIYDDPRRQALFNLTERVMADHDPRFKVELTDRDDGMLVITKQGWERRLNRIPLEPEQQQAQAMRA